MENRNSRQRQKIWELLNADFVHMSAQDIYDRLKRELPGLSLGTVYRNLRLLTVTGRARELTSREGISRFEAARQPHDHFQCRVCGMITDLDLSGNRDLESQAARELGAQVESRTLLFTGVCSLCLDKTKETH